MAATGITQVRVRNAAITSSLLEGESNNSPIIIPEGVIAYAPVKANSTQPLATSNPFNLMVAINSSSMSQFEENQLQTVLWFTSDGTIIPSWIESGWSNSSENTVYWLLLPFSIKANGISTIYIGFEKMNASPLNSMEMRE